LPLPQITNAESRKTKHAPQPKLEPQPEPTSSAPAGPNPSTLTFAEVSHGLDADIHVAHHYQSNVVISWGDAIVPGLPEFEPAKLTPETQRQRFGYNNDFIAYMPLPRGSQNSERGLLCVNHEYSIAYLMFPGIKDKLDAVKKLTKEQVEIELAAHGHAVVEVRRDQGFWIIDVNSPYNRRLTAETPMHVSGPAAGHKRLQTNADPTGKLVLGTINNCAGGFTPWGTVLTAEENFDTCFSGKIADPKLAKREQLNYARLGLNGVTDFAWSRHVERFDLAKEPLEPNRFGWIVEYDPYDPKSTPIKRTALGRCKHEGATVTLSHDQRVVVYTGDDSRGEYLYRFVSDRPYQPNNREANRDLLDHGTLSVARFEPDGRLEWLPLVHGREKLGKDQGFHSQADVLIEVRRAGDAIRATPLDRPEDVEVHAASGRVFVMLTNNATRLKPNDANPRIVNLNGHILELQAPAAGGKFDHAADEFKWDIFLLAGDPSKQDGAQYHPQTSANGWLTCPDNAAIDAQGRLWIATDGAPKVTGNKLADGIYATDTSGPGRALTRMFFRAPTGAEVTGTAFTPDMTTLFVSIQHPGDEEVDGIRSTFDAPSTRWPDFKPDMPPRPSVIAIRRQDGGLIGT
jgi:secreted PhoX family phosphatase